MLTLVGPGGIGKTRLALAVLAARRGAFMDGGGFVSLAPLSSAAFLVPAVAEALGLTLYKHAEPQAQLLDNVRDKEMLVVLDNFEHLLVEHGAGLVSAILQDTAGVKLLVTSHERLNVHGEWVFALQGLPVPPPPEPALRPGGPPSRPAPDRDGVEHLSAVKLFVDGARRALSSFVLSEKNWAEVAHICRLVEGMPLGIELAAAWLPVLTCREIAQELERRLDSLASARRDVPERHRSLRAVFDQTAWLDRLQQDIDNLRAAMEWPLGEARPMSGERVAWSLRLAGALARFWHGHAHLQEGLHWLKRGLAAGDGCEPPVPALVRAKALGTAGWLARNWGSFQSAKRHLQQSLAIYREWGDKRGIAGVLDSLGDVAWAQGDYELADHHYREGPALQREMGYSERVAMALTSLGEVALDRGDHGRAVRLFEEALSLQRPLGDKRGIALSLAGLGAAAG